MIKQPEKKLITKKYMGTLGVIIIAAIVIVISIFYFNYISKKAADETTASLSKFYLEEIADRTVYEINTVLKNNTEQLERAIREMSSEKIRTEKDLREYLKMVQKLNGLNIFAVVDENGMVYTSDNKFSGISRFGFLSEPIKKTKIYTTRTDKSNAMLLIAMPVKKMHFADNTIISCITGVDVANVISAQQLQGINNQVVCRLFDGNDGMCVVGADGTYSDGNSIFDVWKESCSFDKKYTYEKLVSDWNKHKEGYSYYRAKEGHTYLYYKPVPNTDWMVSARLREGVISEQIKTVNNKLITGSQFQIVVVIVSMVLVFIFAVRQIQKTKSIQFEREKEEELLRQEAKASEEKIKLQEKLLEEEKASNRQSSVLQILSKEYTSVFYYDINEESAVPIRLASVSIERYDLEINKPVSLKKFFERYVQDLVQDEDKEEMLKFADPYFLRKLLEKDDRYTYLYKIYRNGQELYAQLRIAKAGDDNELRYVVMGFAIVDETVRAEQERQETLKNALAQAESANKAKTIFLNNMSHDIRTPMNAIIGFTNIALKHEASTEVRGWLEKISESSEHLLTLINDVLDISRIESGKVIFNPIPIDIGTVIDTVLDIMNGFLSDRNLKFNVIRDKLDNPYIIADAVRIREILVNVLSNAVKFTDDGGEITFEVSIEKASDTDSGIMCYRISDTGIGMSKEFTEHIFDEFAQEEIGARTQYKGTGLGMAITKHYIDIMGGTIVVESEKGVGSSFTIRIPFQYANTESDEKEQYQNDDIDLKGINVLLAEDNDLNAEIAIMQLKENGLEVTRASNGKEALEIFENNPANTFDIILMDIMMPVMNGYEATKAIRSTTKQPDGKTIPIIALSANAFAEDIQSSLDAGMDAHISKPIDINIMFRTLKNCMK